MKNILLGLVATLFLIGCSADKQAAVNVEPSLVAGKALDLALNDQFEKAHTLNANTNKVIFVFSDDMGHVANDYFATKEVSYLADNNTQFVADISGAPSLIRSMFIMPGLKDFKHTVLLLTEKEASAPYRSGLDTEKIVVAYVANGSITQIKNISTKDELIATIEAK
ncbi:MAG: hypothetical protein ACI9TV_002395 [Sulfurimonas sp.]|jgi:hypothetical protein|uniref:hypothetical protein n=1 Tax=Sulfurimonas sp. TaxID=2022749 RepID=UPI0039E57482